jgi:hypothetical protein
MTLLHLLLLVLSLFCSVFLLHLFFAIAEESENVIVRALASAAFWVFALVSAILVIVCFVSIIEFISSIGSGG